MLETVTQSRFHQLHYAIWPLEIIFKTWNSQGYNSISWNCCAEDVRVFTARQTHGNRTNTAQHCPQTVQCIVQPFSITLDDQ